MKSKLASPPVQKAAVFLLAALLFGLFLGGTDLSAIRDSLLEASPPLLLLALAATMLTYLLRAFRWQVLLAPLGRPGLSNCFEATVIGFMVNFLVFPGRLGEIARPYLLARREGFSASSAFATILLERILDLVTVVFFVGLWLLSAPPPSDSEEAIAALKIGGLIGLAGAIVALGSMFVFVRYPERSLGWVKRALRVLPDRVEALTLGFVETFGAGLRVLVDWARLANIAFLSTLLWLNVSLAFWFGARALGVEFSYGDTFLVIGFLTVGVALPTPGAIGGYHVMCALALTMLFHTEPSLAKAVALVNHAIAFLPVTFLGIVLFAKAGLSFRQIKTMTSSS